MTDLKDKLRVTPPPRPNRLASMSNEVDVERLWETIDKMASAVNRSAGHTEQLPEIKRKVEATSDTVIELSTELRGVGERVTKIENKVDRGHDCFQIDVISEIKDNQRESSQKIDKDVQKGIAHAGELAAVIKDQSQTEADVQDIKKAPRRMFYGLLGVIVVLISGGLSAAWFLAKLETNVAHEQRARVEQFKRIEVQMEAVASKSDTAPVEQALSDLEDELETANGHEEEFNRMCDGMPRHEKRMMKTALQRRGKRVPASCMR